MGNWELIKNGITNWTSNSHLNGLIMNKTNKPLRCAWTWNGQLGEPSNACLNDWPTWHRMNHLNKHDQRIEWTPNKWCHIGTLNELIGSAQTVQLKKLRI